MILSKNLVAALMSLSLLTLSVAPPVRAQDVEAEKPFVCEPAPEPVIGLSIGSRYEKDSATRSDISEQSNQDVDEALKPVEDFINDLSKMANVAYVGDPDAQANADCVMDWLHVWAAADGLSELDSLNARLAISPRLAGMALAYLQAKKLATPNQQQDEVTIAWFEKHSKDVVDFFAEEAGPLASTNNLRAWAALATAAIGRISGDEPTLLWARDSYKLLVCGAEDSGALPAEMERGERALHYQLHAIAPLVVAIAIIDPNGEADEELCRVKLEQIVEFTVSSVEHPEKIADLVGKDQVFSGEDDTKPAAYQFAWAEAYLARYENPALEALISPMRPLRYSKLGGDLTEIYGMSKPSR
jgi:poly(beta-D-mannuronate) lyase